MRQYSAVFLSLAGEGDHRAAMVEGVPTGLGGRTFSTAATFSGDPSVSGCAAASSPEGEQLERMMPEYAFPLRPAPTVPVEGDRPFPVRRIFCVGRNYAAHRAEMGGDDRDPPFFFAKPADAIVPPGRDAPYPSATGDLHHEIELVIAIGPGGSVFGYAVGVDLTRRDLQAAAKAKGQPWDAAKGFDHSAPISAIRKLDNIGDAKISLSVNGAVRQSAAIGDMIWAPSEIVAEAGKLWALQAGDLIYTGTPEGVGPLQRGDLVEGEIEGIGALSFRIT